jgi:DNA uptake protein ComE-like DNA-binding protein
VHKYQWAELITSGLLGRLSSMAAVDLTAHQGAISDALISIFRSTGGLPVVATDLDETGKTDLALRLISDAIDRYASQTSLRGAEPGYHLVPSAGGRFDQEIIPVPKVNLNAASAHELEALPSIGQELARRAIHERTANGSFTSIDDFAVRVPGIGDGAADILREAVSVLAPAPDAFEWNFESDLDSRFTIALGLFPRADRADAVVRLLHSIAATAAGDPHPLTKEKQPRDDGSPELTMSAVDWIGVLTDGDYYRRLPDLLESAVVSIKVAMFHAALPDDDHPTRRLLDELVSANQRGVDVKVLLDQDRDTDPYKSTVINTAARSYLLARGVDCQFDTADRLLHSKFVVIDDSTCVIGSHNWSAGSYFQFDDLSLVVGSAELGARLSTRFDLLWPT